MQETKKWGPGGKPPKGGLGLGGWESILIWGLLSNLGYIAKRLLVDVLGVLGARNEKVGSGDKPQKEGLGCGGFEKASLLRGILSKHDYIAIGPLVNFFWPFKTK